MTENFEAPRYLTCSLESFDKTFFKGEVIAAHLPAVDGDLVIESGSAPLLTLLRPGSVRFVLPENKPLEAFFLSSGFVAVTSGSLKILVRDAATFQESVPLPFVAEHVFFEGIDP